MVVNTVNSSLYRHENVVIEACFIIYQFIGRSQVPGSLVSLVEEPSVCLSHRIHVEGVRDVQFDVRCSKAQGRIRLTGSDSAAL